MDACSQCPHPNDCLKVGSCLDEVNARYLAEHRNQFPRLMTSAQANIFMARLRDDRYRSYSKVETSCSSQYPFRPTINRLYMQ
jgi:hypothetical protein